jgi:hypothetical protein
MNELATVHHLVLYAVLIVATMLALDWFDTRRTRACAPRRRLPDREERRMNEATGSVRLPVQDESVAPVTILDGQGRIVRIVQAEEFRRLHPLAAGSPVPA